MNIPINEEHITLTGVEELGGYFKVTESIGFSTGDEVPGFNRAGAGEDDGNGGSYPVYVDGQGNPYPKVSKAALVFLPYLNLFHKDDIEIAPVGQITVRENETEGQAYSEIALSENIVSKKDGWYTLYTFLLDAFHPDEDNIPASGVYFDKSGEVIREAATSRILDSADLIDRDDVAFTINHFFITTKMQIKLNDLTGEMVDAAILKGECSKEYKKAQRAVFFFEAQISGAHVKFRDTYRHLAQQIIEDLENSSSYGDC